MSGEKLGPNPEEMGVGPETSVSEEDSEKGPEITNIGKRPSRFREGEYVSDVERLILGGSMPDQQRKVFAPIQPGWVTGEVGFLDFAQEEKMLLVTEMGIEPEYRGRGFGSQLVDALEHVAQERKIENIKFHAVDRDNKPMVRLLRQRGYRPTQGFSPEIFVKTIKQSKTRRK